MHCNIKHLFIQFTNLIHNIQFKLGMQYSTFVCLWWNLDRYHQFLTFSNEFTLNEFSLNACCFSFIEKFRFSVSCIGRVRVINHIQHLRGIDFKCAKFEVDLPDPEFSTWPAVQSLWWLCMESWTRLSREMCKVGDMVGICKQAKAPLSLNWAAVGS